MDSSGRPLSQVGVTHARRSRSLLKLTSRGTTTWPKALAAFCGSAPAAAFFEARSTPRPKTRNARHAGKPSSTASSKPCTSSASGWSSARAPSRSTLLTTSRTRAISAPSADCPAPGTLTKMLGPKLSILSVYCLFLSGALAVTPPGSKAIDSSASTPMPTKPLLQSRRRLDRNLNPRTNPCQQFASPRTRLA